MYESQSYWDKEKKQPRSKRTLIGKLDDETGEIIPTGKSGRKKRGKEQKTETADDAEKSSRQARLIEEKDKEIKLLKAEIRELKKEKTDILNSLQKLCRKMSEEE